MTCGRVKASARKMTSGWVLRTSAMHHSQKGRALVCGLSTRKMRTPLSIQKAKTENSSCQRACQSLDSKLMRVDVLVLLGRVFGVLDGAVRPDLEPVRVLTDPGVVGRALEGDVEGDVDAEAVGGGDHFREVGEGAEFVQDGLVAAVGVADGPGTADVAGFGDTCCCFCPCGTRCRWGEWAACRARRSPWPRPRAAAWSRRAGYRAGRARRQSGERTRTSC